TRSPETDSATRECVSLRSIPARGVWTPSPTPVQRRFLVQDRRRLLHLGDVVGGADLLILLIGGVVADKSAAAPRSVGVDIDVVAFPLRDDDRVLRQRLKLGHFQRSV